MARRHSRIGGVIGAGVILSGLTLLGIACGLFKVREPEGGGPGPQVPWQIPTEPHTVLVNLKATTDLGSITNFEREFTTDPAYAFRFDPFQAIGQDTVWDRDRDIQALTALLASRGPITLTWTPTDSGSIGSDRFYRNLGYRLAIQRSSSDTSHAVILGNCNLYLTLQGTNWMVRRWEDLQSGDYSQTWGWARLNTSLPR